MVTNALDDYEKQMKALVEEVRRYRDAGSTLQDVSTSLQRIGTINNDVALSLGEAATGISETLTTLQSLRLEDVEARNSEHFTQHQQALDRVVNEVQGLVREQQRLALESLQHSNTLQRQFDALSGDLKGKIDVSLVDTQRQTVATGTEIKSLIESLSTRTTLMDDRTTSIEKSLTDLTTSTTSNSRFAAQSLTMVRNLLILLVILVIVVGVVVFVR